MGLGLSSGAFFPSAGVRLYALCFGGNLQPLFVRKGQAVRGQWAAALIVAIGWPASAQSSAAPNPAASGVPDLDVPEASLADERKYFLFHKAGVTFDAAQQDLTFCSRYIARGAQRKYPTFVAWQRPQGPRPVVQTYQYGLVGAAIGAIIAGPIDRSIRQSRLIRCMVPRGYARYRTSEAVWRQVNGDDLAQSIALQARIASGPMPPTPRTYP